MHAPTLPSAHRAEDQGGKVLRETLTQTSGELREE